MCSNKECADYFKSQRAYHRCFEELRKKWKSYGKAAGRITLRQTSEEERRAVGGREKSRREEKGFWMEAADILKKMQEEKPRRLCWCGM